MSFLKGPNTIYSVGLVLGYQYIVQGQKKSMTTQKALLVTKELYIDFANFYGRFPLAVNKGEIKTMTASMRYAKMVQEKASERMKIKL